MSKIKFNSGQNKNGRSKLRIALIVLACVIGAILLAGAVLGAVVWIRSRPQGEASLTGTYAPTSQTEYVVWEYSEYFSEVTTRELSVFEGNENVTAGEYELYNAYGRKVNDFCGKWDGETSPEELRDEILAAFKNEYGYSDENMKKVKFYLYLPTGNYRFAVTGAVIEEEGISVTVRLISEEGAAQEFTLNGTYQLESGRGTVQYGETELPPAVLEFLQKMDYSCFVNVDNVYVNAITFSELITLEQ